MTTLVEKVLALSEALTAAGVDHAFGNAIALAYCTEDPRGTRDVRGRRYVVEHAGHLHRIMLV